MNAAINGAAPLPPKPPLPSSTMLMLRDDAEAGLQVFMVKRNYAIDFASGALVFPGGKLAEGDFDPALSSHVTPGNFAADLLPYALGAIRESFEESGLLLARPKGSARFLDAARVQQLHDWREPLNRGERSLRDLAEAEQIDFALDALVPFAHWITPQNMPKRFDTWFFLAPAPADQIGSHDGSEAVESEWVNPDAALAAWEAKQKTIVFATRMQLVKLARSRDCATAFKAAATDRIISVMPVLDKEAPGEPHLRIPEEAGYGVTSVPLSKIGM